MNLFKKLLQGDKSKLESTAHFSRKFNSDSYIVANSILGDWNDPSEVLDEKSMILEIIPKHKNAAAMISAVNKLYYDKIHYYYSLSEEQCKSISHIINLDIDNYRELDRYWPKTISEEDYKQLHSILNLNFVSAVPLPVLPKPLYVISINKNFWLKSPNHQFSTAGFNTYERRFLEEELIHQDFNKAFKYATVITSRLWADRGPNNSYYFTERLLEELENARAVHKNIPLIDKLAEQISQLEASIIDYNDYCNRNRLGLTDEEIITKVMSEYERVFELYRPEFGLLQSVYEVVTDAPFHITRVE